ncbi:MAG: exopolysaccharide biosynthesis protein [Alphaproteobacteria bacterium]|nr:exopolysaccharide biosynthesis protein [Alphaproteobacteria bacterium]
MSADNDSTENLEDVVDTLRDLADREEEVSVGDVQDAVGQRSFAPFLLICGLIVMSPLGGIPGVPTVFAFIILLTAGQLLIGRNHFWLPDVLTDRSVDDNKLRKAAEKLESPARWVDKVIKPRLTVLTDGPAAYVVAAACVALALAMPPLEAVPFAVAAPAAAITAFSLALVAHDGVLAVIGYLATAGSIYVVSLAPIF